MAMSLPRYNVLVADPQHPGDPDHATEHQVTILHGDQLRAELEGPRNGIPGMDVAPMHGITLWIWAALARTHAIDQPFQEFRSLLLAFEDATKNAEPGRAPTPADPTQLAAGSGSPSASPSTSGTSTAGSPGTSPTPTV